VTEGIYWIQDLTPFPHDIIYDYQQPIFILTFT